jgi:hypothetical protein
MVVTLDARRHDCCESGSKSRISLLGDTVSNSSANGMKDGLFARTHHLEDEDPDALAALRARYFRENQPRDAREEFLVNECYLGDVLGQRYKRALTNELRGQQRQIRQRWDEARQETVGLLRDQFVDSATVEIYPILVELKAFGHGLEYLAGEWLRLKTGITTRGCFTPQEMNMGVRLMGVKPALETVCQHQDAFLFMLWSLFINPAAPAGMIDSLLDPANRPAGLADATREELLPDVASVREQLIRWIDGELAGLAALAERVAREVDGPELARVLNPAALVIDPEKAKRFERAQKNYQSTFYRAHAALEAHRKRQPPSPPGGEGARRADEGEIPAGAAHPPDIKPPARDGGKAETPSEAPEAATQVVGDTPESARGGQPEAVLQNDPKTGPERPPADHPGACRSYHKQAANEAVGGIVTAPRAGRTPGRCVKRTTRVGKVARRCASRTGREDQNHESIAGDRT